MSPLSQRDSSDSLFSDAASDSRIPGLYIFPGVLPANSASESRKAKLRVACLDAISQADLFAGRDQVMLFSNIPEYLGALLSELQRLVCIPGLEQTLWEQPLTRQIILNLYPPGKGITSHVDLPHRYADGIVGVSLCGGCSMIFTREKRVEVYLPPRTVYVLSGEARWDWAHGIPERTRDVVDGVTRLRDTRVSVTFRWIKPGGDELVDGA